MKKTFYVEVLGLKVCDCNYDKRTFEIFGVQLSNTAIHYYKEETAIQIARKLNGKVREELLKK
ncbi:hypothetical protein D3C80_2007630 [compost metagenome]